MKYLLKFCFLLSVSFLSSCERTHDIIVSAYDENSGDVLRHLELCCPTDTCRVFIYSSLNQDSQRSHEHVYRNKKHQVEHANHDIDTWLSVNTSYEKFGKTVDNTLTGTEATAYITHVIENYDNLADTLAFVHGHIHSWHSRRMCDIIIHGLRKLRRNVTRTVYVNINKPHPRRCMSMKGISGDGTSIEMRDHVFKYWKNWTHQPTPTRISWECCAQFVTNRESIHHRGYLFWQALNTTMTRCPLPTPERCPPFEYLWPTLIDEEGTLKKSRC